MAVLPHWRTVRSTLCVATRLPVSLRCEQDWSLQAPTPSPDTILSYHRPPPSCIAVTWMRCHACACCTTIGKGQVRHVWPQHQAPITASLHSGSPDFYVARFFFFCTPADHSCGTHFDLLTTVFMLTCGTRSLVACLRLMTRRRLWKFSTSAPHLQFPCRIRASRCQWRERGMKNPVSKRSSHQHSVVVSSPFCVWLRTTATTGVSVPDRAIG